MTFLYNRWYAAAWSGELRGPKPIGRKILGEDVALYRTAGGQVVAMASRCPHRFAPLHVGDVVGDALQCRYHGLRFGPDGACVYNPDGSKPPPMKVKTYSLGEKDGMVWIWMGEGAPDRELPDVLSLDPAFGGAVRGYLQPRCHYQIINDNLLDHAHATHLHAMFKTEALEKNPKGEIFQDGDFVHHNSWAPGAPPNPFWLNLIGRVDNVDQWVDIKWEAPSLITVAAGVTPSGQPRSEGVRLSTVHLVTPESETSAHYFWIAIRDAKLEDHEFSEKVREITQTIFSTEDLWMMEAQQQMMQGADFWDLKPVLMPQDRATALARRHLEKLIAQQHSGTAA